jgi:DNA-binding transcriptional MocR family regulator
MTVIRFSRGVPPPEAIPAAALAELTAAIVAEHGPAMFQYPPIGRHLGDPRLRTLVGQTYGVDPDAVFVTNGSLQALDILAAHFLDGPDKLVYVEGPTYDRAARIFERYGARVVSIPVAGDGIDVDELRRRVSDRVPDLLYTIPDFQNPSGVTLSEPKRRELVRLAASYGFPVVEDIPYRELRFRGNAPPRLAEISSDANVITLGSLSKVLSPGLRVGYAITDPDTALRLAERSEGIYLSPVPLSQAVAAEALAGGLVKSNLDTAREFLRPRHDAAVGAVRALLGEALMSVPDGGYYVGVQVDPGTDEDTFVEKAKQAEVALIASSAFYPRAEMGAYERLFLRLPFQSLSPAEFRTGIERLAAIVR